ncbi:PDR/VanB family oxidoreductase [Actinoplanes sp. NPDC051861]|uniref:PDR/VanB family oxidoreductase n=1 Tax=Actinoplanes sp. NPDC051861 TaxID=3155170 RepID=UPI0034246E31
MDIDLVVVDAGRPAEDVVTLRLARPDGGPLPDWAPGAHIDLVLSDDLVRQYSLCGTPSDAGEWRIAVLNAPDGRGGSKAVHDLAAGDRVRARGPRNHFPLEPADRYVFVAGGIGITPLLPMISAADTAGAAWELHYGGRRRPAMAFLQDLQGYGQSVHVSPQDECGLLDLDTIVAGYRPGTLIYACGPEPMLAALEQRCAGLELRLERFAGQAVDTGGDREFEVVLERSGQELTVPPGRSIFEVVREAGVSVLGSCLEGTCGTCETEVLDGEVEHRDTVLTAAERESNECMMICVSRACGSRLTLDL